MSQTAVIYKSHYGASRQYAIWIAEAVSAKLFERKDANLTDLSDCDTIVYVGGLYAGGISGFGWVRRHYKKLCGKTLIVVSVGSAFPDANVRKDVARRNFTTAMLEDKVRLFALRGALDYPAMTTAHRAMMKVFVGVQKRTPAAKRTQQQQAVIDSYGNRMNFINRDAIIPIALFISDGKASRMSAED